MNEGPWAVPSGNRVNLGGSFDNAARNARSANRNNDTPRLLQSPRRNHNLGVRLSKTSLRPIAAVVRETIAALCSVMPKPMA